MSADYFFASYARADKDAQLEKFVRELRKELRRLAGLNPGDGDSALAQIGFFDVSNIQTGDEWRTVLGTALRTCKVCVCLCSPTYFNRLACGKEYTVFTQRRDAWLAVPGHAGQPARVIVPVLWTPSEPLPQGISLFQNDESKFPANYRIQGLRNLAELKSQREKFLTVVKHLARVVWAAIQDVALPQLPDLPVFDQIESAFHKPSRFGVVIAPLHPAGTDWKPFTSGSSVGYEAESIASQQRRRIRAVVNDAALGVRLNEARAMPESIILLADPDVLVSPAVAPVLQALDAGGARDFAVLVLWNSLQGKPQAKVDAVLAAAAANCPQTHAAPDTLHDWTSIDSPERLRAQLASAFERLSAQLLAGAPAARAVDLDAERTAKAAGVPTERPAALKNVAASTT